MVRKYIYRKIRKKNNWTGIAGQRGLGKKRKTKKQKGGLGFIPFLIAKSKGWI